MVKFGVTNNEGKPVVVLGLSEENLRLLRRGNEIVVDLRPFGMEGQAVITYGKTEEAITRRLAKAFNVSVDQLKCLPHNVC